jgi:hypothetical protein
MRLSLGSVAALTAGILIALAFWPANRALQAPQSALGQDQPKASDVPAAKPVPAAAQHAPRVSRARTAEPERLLSSDESRDKGSGRIHQALDQMVDFVVEAQPLKDALEFIAKRYNIPVVIDIKGLEDANIEPTTEVKIDVQGIKLKNMLKLLLEQMPQPLGFAVEDQVLKITTREKAQEGRVEVVVYDCRDLVHVRSIETSEHAQSWHVPKHQFEALPPSARFGQPPAQQKSPGATTQDQKPNSGLARRPPSDKTPDAKPAESVTNRRELAKAIRSGSSIPLIRVIENATDPEKWIDNGGAPGTITEFGGLLIVRQTRAVHEEIKHVLADVRQMIKEGAFAPPDQQTGNPATPDQAAADWSPQAEPATPEN